MLSAHNLTKSYGLHTVFQNITFNVSDGERLGLIGPNGCGKTTLMRILAGLDSPDSGIVAHTRPGLRIGYLPQGINLDPTLSFADAFIAEPSRIKESEFVKLAAALAENPNDNNLQNQYDQAVDQLSTRDSSHGDTLASLGLADIASDHLIGKLSGGQKTRLMLARLVLQSPKLLLLDEPTNHLDIGMLEWLENWLQHFRGSALIVSHDRTFLDNTISSILELDPSLNSFKQYAGNYSDYIEQKRAEQEHKLQTYNDQQAEIFRMKADILRTKEQAAHTERSASSIRIGGPDYKVKGYKAYKQSIAKGTAKKAKAREKKLERFLEASNIVERPQPSWQLKLKFAATDHVSRDILVAENLSIGYPENEPVLTGLRLQIRGGERIALTGPNGCGKTTLLRTFSRKLKPMDGSLVIGQSVKIGYMTQEQEHLDLEKSPLEIIQNAGIFNQTEARHFLHFYLFSGDDPSRPTGSMSYGERSRLELALLVAQGCTFLLLDEPINHLDIPSRGQFEHALTKFTGTILAVVHDRYFIEKFSTKIWVIEDGRIKQ